MGLVVAHSHAPGLEVAERRHPRACYGGPVAAAEVAVGVHRVAARGHADPEVAVYVLELGSLRPAWQTWAHLGSRRPVAEHEPIRPAVHSDRYPIAPVHAGRSRCRSTAGRSDCRGPNVVVLVVRAVRHIYHIHHIRHIRHTPRTPRILHNSAASVVHAGLVGVDIAVLAASVAGSAGSAIARSIVAGATPGSCRTAAGVPWLRPDTVCMLIRRLASTEAIRVPTGSSRLTGGTRVFKLSRWAQAQS